jgi:hypothetical protein
MPAFAAAIVRRHGPFFLLPALSARAVLPRREV